MWIRNFSFERRLKQKGYRIIVGLDEVGRGAIAGPVVAAAVAVLPDFRLRNIAVADSKAISPTKREKIYFQLIKHTKIFWALGIVSPTLIDKHNIFFASKLAMKRAVLNLKKKIKDKIDYLIVDGGFKIPFAGEQMSIVGADKKIFVCASASIIAKVKRDRLMKRLDSYYPVYQFSKNKGYPTRFHLYSLKIFGPCEFHRKSFRPVKELRPLNK